MGRLEIEDAETMVIDDNGVLLLFDHHIGSGRVRFVDAAVYLASPSLQQFLRSRPYLRRRLKKQETPEYETTLLHRAPC